MNDPHMSNIAAFIGFFVACALFMMLCVQIDKLINSRRSIKKTRDIKVGCVITNKIPKPENPAMPSWANKLMENRVTGEVLPVCADQTGFWHFPHNSEPVKLSLREWTIKND